jgi:hypothetical protein
MSKTTWTRCKPGLRPVRDAPEIEEVMDIANILW